MKFLRVVIILTIASLLVSACGGGAATPLPPPTKGGEPAAPTAVPQPKGLPPAAEGTLLRKIQDRGKIVVGVKYDVPLFGYLNPTTNQLEGFDVEMGKAIAEYIFGDPTKIEFKEAISKNRIPFLKDGVVDLVISTMTINADREKEIDFSVVYYLAGQSLLVPKASAITSVKDLEGKKVGTVKGSTSEKNVRAAAPKADVQLFDTYSEAVAAMEAGRVEAVTTDDIILLGFVSKEPDKWKLVGGQFTFEPYGIGVAKGHPELLEVVDKVVKDMKASGKWKELYAKVLPGEVPEPPIDNWRDIKKLPLAAEGTLLRKIQDRGKIVVGVKYDVPLFGYLNPTTNQLEGFDVEMGKAIAEYIFGDPTKIEFKEAISKNRIPFLKDGVVDLVISTMTINADREKEIDFSVVYYLAGQSLLVPKASAITSVKDLEGKKVGTVKGSTSEKNVRAAAPKADVQLFDTYSEAVAAMEAGRVEVVTTDDIILLGFVSKEPDKWKLVGGQFTFEPYGIGVAKDHPELLEVVNKVVRDMKVSGKWKDLYAKIIPGDVPEPPLDDWHEIVK